MKALRTLAVVTALAILLPAQSRAGYEILWSVPTYSDAPTYVTRGPAQFIGDIDGDGASEIVGLSVDNSLLKVVDSNSGYVELALASTAGTWGTVSLFDVDGDGRPEILANEGNSVGTTQLVAVGFLGVAGVTPEEGAARVSLLGVAPNPAAGSVVFELDVQRRSHVCVRMFDLSGRLVRVACDQIREPGASSVTWDGTTSDGKAAASGMYFYRIEADGAVVKADKIVIAH